MRSLLKIGFALLVLAFLLIGLGYGMLRAEGTATPGSAEGRMVTSQARAVGNGIASIDLDGPIDMSLRQGAVASLVVRGEQRLLANIDTTQDGATLHIGTKGMLLHHRQPLQVTLVLPQLATVMVRGSGDSTVNGFSGEQIGIELNGSGNLKFNGRYRQVKAALHGSGDLELNGGSSDLVDAALVGSGRLTVVGACKELRLEHSGSGDVDGEHLAAGKATIGLHGSGTSTVNVLDSISVSLHGSGDVIVYGNPTERNVNRTGSGSVDFR